MPIHRVARTGAATGELPECTDVTSETPGLTAAAAASPVSSNRVGWADAAESDELTAAVAGRKPLAARSFSKPDPASGWPPMADIADVWLDAAFEGGSGWFLVAALALAALDGELGGATAAVPPFCPFRCANAGNGTRRTWHRATPAGHARTGCPRRQHASSDQHPRTGHGRPCGQRSARERTECCGEIAACQGRGATENTGKEFGNLPTEHHEDHCRPITSKAVIKGLADALTLCASSIQFRPRFIPAAMRQYSKRILMPIETARPMKRSTYGAVHRLPPKPRKTNPAETRM